MSEVKLKPCPFCGGEAYTYTSHNHEVGRVYLVHCKKCRINYPCNRICKTEEEAIEQWNTRKPIDDIVERLEKIKMNYFLTIANTGDAKNDFAYENVGNALDKAIEIVKGGVED